MISVRENLKFSALVEPAIKSTAEMKRRVPAI